MLFVVLTASVLFVVLVASVAFVELTTSVLFVVLITFALFVVLTVSALFVVLTAPVLFVETEDNLQQFAFAIVKLKAKPVACSTVDGPFKLGETRKLRCIHPDYGIGVLIINRNDSPRKLKLCGAFVFGFRNVALYSFSIHSYDSCLWMVLNHLVNSTHTHTLMCTHIMDLMHYDVIIWGSPSGALHCAFCTRQKFVVPPLSHVKRPVFFGCLARSGYITNWLPNKKM